MTIDPVCLELNSMFPCSRVKTFHRGSAGLYHLFRAIGNKRGTGEVVIPNLCCETVALAARYAGHEVRFADIDIRKLCITPQSLAETITPRTVAVVIVHLFGMAVDANEFDNLRKRHCNVIFIEDVAHAAGGFDKSNREVGSGFDHAMFSFSDSKILGGEGGAIVSHREDEVSDEFHESEGEAYEGADLLLALSLRNLVHAIADLHRAGSQGAGREIGEGIWERFRPMITGGGLFGDRERAASDLRNRLEIAQHRRRIAITYRNGINNPKFLPTPIKQRETVWRYTIIAETCDLRRKATEALRRAGIHASNHYFPLNRIFNLPSMPESENIGDRLLNLWVDDSVSLSQISAASKILNQL